MVFVSVLWSVVGCTPSALDQGGDLDTNDPHPDLSTPIVPASNDPCGAKDPTTGAYGCAYLVGDCPTPGLSCFCWENGTMVCQENRQWELILDDGCPGPSDYDNDYQGQGCLGALMTCGACTCDSSTETYQCADGGT